PYSFFIKPGLLAAYVTPHRYLSEAAISPPACIHRQLRLNDAPSTCIPGGTTGLHHSSIPSTRLVAHMPSGLTLTALSSAYSTAKPVPRLPLGPPLLAVRMSPSCRERIRAISTTLITGALLSRVEDADPRCANPCGENICGLINLAGIRLRRG